jgi:hypothetical protein
VVIGFAHQVMLPLVADPLAFAEPPLLDELPLLGELPPPLLQAASVSTEATPSVVSSASFGLPRLPLGTNCMVPLSSRFGICAIARTFRRVIRASVT